MKPKRERGLAHWINKTKAPNLKVGDNGHIAIWRGDDWIVAYICEAAGPPVRHDVRMDGCPVCLKYHGLAQELVAIANLERSVS